MGLVRIAIAFFLGATFTASAMLREDTRYDTMRACMKNIFYIYGDTCAEADADQQGPCVLELISECIP